MFDGVAIVPEPSAVDGLLAEDERGASVVVSDPWLPDNPFVFVSPQFTEQTGYTAAEALGRNGRFLQGPDTDPAAVRRLREAVRREEPIELEILNYRRDGTPFWNRLRIRPSHSTVGRLTHFIAVQRELSRPLPPRFR